MFGIFAKSFLTATRNEPRAPHRNAQDLPKLGWLDEDMPFRNHAGRRSGRDD
ncbi:hypothetical protein SAMN05216376_103323 [Mameliella alba]|uniref:hypothetical protein n=1 Tax=Mameliella alba TaxID=561184 RepID=UPI0008811302|nr:hypothetical protein [Mameliella alba]PTR40800.1 hypothetical protein LX94_01254 [Mameliella alba]GGF46430.1 hypothetical protein GCM10011319_05110 [Mameliella alba]SDC64079.1 hypothetical protein SAMN05216376_103323 [Mameliella alba]